MNIDWNHEKVDDFVLLGGIIMPFCTDIWTAETMHGIFLRIEKNECRFCLSIHNDFESMNYSTWCAILDSSHKSFELAEKNVSKLLRRIISMYSSVLKDVSGTLC